MLGDYIDDLTEALSHCTTHWRFSVLNCVFPLAQQLLVFPYYSSLMFYLREQRGRVSNRPFPSSLVPLFQNESKCETFHMKMSSACSFIFMQIKVIFIRMVSLLDSLWNRGTRELGNGLLSLLHILMIWITFITFYIKHGNGSFAFPDVPINRLKFGIKL